MTQTPGGVTVKCRVGQVYPQPDTRLLVISATGTTRDLAKWTNSSIEWREGKFNQNSVIFLPTEDSNQDNSDSDVPVLNFDDIVKCEVGLQGTDYNVELYRKLETLPVNNGATKTFDHALIILLAFGCITHLS